jgi:hypothetical protein
VEVREPALPVDPRLPGEPMLVEVNAARMWLGRRGVVVWLPTRLLALRLGSREWAAKTTPWVVVVGGGLAAVASFLQEVPGRFGVLFAVAAVLQVVRSREIRRREELAERLAGTGTPPALREAARQVGGWYLAAAATTFLGGAALCAAEIVVAPSFDACAQTFALAAGAAATVAIVGRILRAPVIAEDPASLAVDGLLRAQDAYRYAPSALFGVVVMPQSVRGPLVWFAVAYLVVVLGLQLTGWLLTRYRKLPPGFYGR